MKSDARFHLKLLSTFSNPEKMKVLRQRTTWLKLGGPSIAFSLSLSPEPELRRLSRESVGTLDDLVVNLWNFGSNKYAKYCAHIEEILFARDKLQGSRNQTLHNSRIRDLSLTYMKMNRTVECEALLTGAIAEAELSNPGDPGGEQFRSLLGLLRSQQGKHAMAEDICRQAVLSLRDAVGIGHQFTRDAYTALNVVLDKQQRWEDGRGLVRDFYVDVHRTISAQLLPDLRKCMELCEKYIEKWVSESQLQKLVRNCYIMDDPLDVRQRNTMVLQTVFFEGLSGSPELGVTAQMGENWRSLTGETMASTLKVSAHLIGQRIEPVGRLESPSLRQRAIEVVQELKRTKFLVPLWMFGDINSERAWTKNFDWKTAEQNVIHSLEDVAIDVLHPTMTPQPKLLTDARRPELASALANCPADPRSSWANGSKYSMVVSPATHQYPSLEASSTVHSAIAMPNLLPWPSLVPPRSQLTGAFPQLPNLARSDHVDLIASSSSLSWNAQPSFSQTWSPTEEGEFLNDALSHNWFSPTMMNTPTPPFTFSLLQTPHPSRMSPPPRPGQDSPAAEPSLILAGRPDFPTPQSLFGLPQSPLPPSPSFGSNSWPMS